jgi:hypothetical protein
MPQPDLLGRGPSPKPAELLAAQRVLGNRAVARLVERRRERAAATTRATLRPFPLAEPGAPDRPLAPDGVAESTGRELDATYESSSDEPNSSQISRDARRSGDRQKDESDSTLASRMIQRTPAAPVFLGLSATAWGTAANVAGVLAATAGGVAAVATVVARGTNGFGSLNLPANLISEQDKLKLQRVIQIEIINRYVDRYLAAHPEAAGGGTGTEGATAPPAAGPAPASGGTGGPSGAPSASAIDEAILETVKTTVQMELAADLERAESSQRSFRWGEDNTQSRGEWSSDLGETESVGVTGTLNVRNLESVAIKRTPNLSSAARDAGITVDGAGRQVTIHKFIGGMITGSATWSAWDNLSVNFEPGSAQEGVNWNGGPKLTVRTHWYWDRYGPDSETWLEVTIAVNDSGGCDVSFFPEGEP